MSSKWAQLVRSFPGLLVKIKEHHREQLKDIENLKKATSSCAFLTCRKPLGDAKNRLMKKALTPSLPSTATTFPKRVMYKHKLCPLCKAPAKQLNYRRTECTKCRYDYCSACLKAWHNGDCERQKSPKRLSNESSVGSKRSKKNLRRL